MSACSPDPAPAIWLCDSKEAGVETEPSWLTGHERQRLATLAGRVRQEFLASRWLIRHALASASGHPVRDCRPVDGRAVQSSQPPGWRLSISHSLGLAGCAVSKNRKIGLDLEPLSRKPQWRRIATRWFLPMEQAWLLATNDHQAFLRVWTLKEAWLKATDRGIADNLQTLSVSEGFTLAGDRPGEPWHASLGQIEQFLVAVVYQGEKPPEGHLLGPSVISGNVDSPVNGMASVRWEFHTPIGDASVNN